MATVQTVAGPRDTSDLGQVLMPEHLFVLTPEIAAEFPDLSWDGRREERVSRAVNQLSAVRERGIETIVDLTVLGLGRSIENVQEVAAQVDMNIIVATGMYTYDHLPHFFESRPPGVRGRDIMTDMFVRDIVQGIGGSGVRAAILKCCTDTPGVTSNIERVLRAVARAHRETGVPITTHTDAVGHMGLRQQMIFAEEGVDLARVVIGHSGDTTDVDYLRRIMDEGSTIGCDRFGIYREGTLTFEERVDTVARLCAEGYADRIVLSHDLMCHSDVRPPRQPDGQAWHVGMTHICDDVLPALRLRGVTEQQVEQMLTLNPARIFDAQSTY
jgi:phosphotriesterase-related protein